MFWITWQNRDKHFLAAEAVLAQFTGSLPQLTFSISVKCPQNTEFDAGSKVQTFNPS